ncbi:MAG: 50S ribosomal protein L10 [Actinomycetota bacterium]|jgi:large subunit ribosomal protein L10|nr:50S ribosomal protein L10 [Actinomycetota bacterium]
MNRDEKAAVIDDMAREIDAAETIFVVDYRGISVKQSADLRGRLGAADASFRVVKNRLGLRAADQADAEGLKPMLEGPTALTFVRGDAALAAKELAAFRRENGLLVFKGGTMNGDALSADDVEAISRLPARDILYGQLVGVVASPVTGLVRGLAGLISGVARQLQQIKEQGLVGGGGGEATGGDAAEPPEPAAEAPGDPVSEAAAAEEESADGDEAAAESATEK